MEICNPVQHNDFRGKIFAEGKDLVTIGVIKQIAKDFKINTNYYFFAIVFEEGKFYLLGTKDKESLKREIIEDVKKFKIEMNFEKFLSYFKRLNFCLSYNEKILEKNFILDN